MQVPQNVRTTTAAYVAGASCAVGSMGVYLLLSHRMRKLQRDHEDELFDLESYYKRKLEKADRQIEFSRKPHKAGTWVGALSNSMGNGVAGEGRELEPVGPDGSLLAIEADSSAENSSFNEASSVVPSDGEVPNGAEPDLRDDQTDGDADPGSDSPVQSEEPVRVDGRPYVISTAEFYEDKETYQKLSVVYYSGDRILADEHDQPIPDITGMIGHNIRQRFGRKSDDPLIVHIRNDHLEIDFEVRHDERTYKDVVFGYGDPTSVGAANTQAEE